MVGLGDGLVGGSSVAGDDEAFVFLLAVLGMRAGSALLLGSSPLFTGLIIGAVFTNIVTARLSVYESALEDLEQPVVLSWDC